MDQGVFYSIKQVNRKQMLIKIVELEENDNIANAAILDAINLLSIAWKMVSPEKHCNCFHHAGLVKNSTEIVNDFDLEDEIPLTLLKINNLRNIDQFTELYMLTII